MTHPAQFINGQWSQGQGNAFNSVNPANNDVIWQASSATAEQVDSAVNSAREAFYSWADKSFNERLEIVKTFAATLKEHSEELAVAIAQETGKPLWETRTEAGAMVGNPASSAFTRNYYYLLALPLAYSPRGVPRSRLSGPPFGGSLP